jgi:hypothetical protein
MPADTQRLADTLDEATRRLERGTNAWVLLPLDQAEALLTGNQPSGEAALLLEALGQLLAKRTRRFVVVAAIRTESSRAWRGRWGASRCVCTMTRWGRFARWAR